MSERLSAWERAGHLRRDESPAIYLHEYTHGGLTVRGLVGALGLDRRATGVDDRAVVPHEGIHPEQVRELADRMAEMNLNPAPILLAHRGPTELRHLLSTVHGDAPWWTFTDKQDTLHRLWAIRDPALHERINEALVDTTALIADGHHRHAAALSLQERHPGTSWDRGLAMLVDHQDTPLFMGAIHREFRGVRLRSLLATVDSHGGQRHDVDRTTALQSLSPGTCVLTDGLTWATATFSERQAPSAVEWLERTLVPALETAPGSVRYHHGVETALAAVSSVTRSRRRRAPSTVVVLLPAPDFDHVLDSATAGRLMPEKATSFQPKPGLGVLMRSVREP